MGTASSTTRTSGTAGRDLSAFTSTPRPSPAPDGHPSCTIAGHVGTRRLGSPGASPVTESVPTLCPAGLFWTIESSEDGHSLHLGWDLGAVVRARAAGCTLDDAYLREHALWSTDPLRTPYLEIGRIPPGTRATWTDGLTPPTITVTDGPGAWPYTPTREGPGVDIEYRGVFLNAVQSLMPGDGPLAAMMSAGLDSTFLVAMMAQLASSERRIHAFVHAPHPDAHGGVVGRSDLDESVLAQQMGIRYAGRVQVIPVVNLARVNPLDAARAVTERSWSPTVHSENEVWLTLIEQHAAELGASVVFVGGQGNYSFSYQPADLRGAGLRGLRAAFPFSRADGVSLEAAVRRLYLGPSERAARGVARKAVDRLGLRRRVVGCSHASVLGAAAQSVGAPSTGDPRLDYLRSLADQDTALSTITHPGARLVPNVDPFTHPEVLRLAASLTPTEWTRGPYPRGFARRVGAGLVPDPIRLRNIYGVQGSDTWFVIKDLRERYLDEAASLSTTPGLSEWFDVAGIRRRVEAWPWGHPEGPNEVEMQAVHQVLTLADFRRTIEERLRALPRSR